MTIFSEGPYFFHENGNMIYGISCFALVVTYVFRTRAHYVLFPEKSDTYVTWHNRTRRDAATTQARTMGNGVIVNAQANHDAHGC